MGILKGRDHSEDTEADGGIILKWIFKNVYGNVDWIDVAQNSDKIAGSCKHGNELSYFITGEVFLD